jgi:hypothetical protein
VTAQHVDDAPRGGATGRIFGYADARDVPVVDDLIRRHPASGLVVRGKGAVSAIARLRAADDARPLIHAPAAWSGTTASAAVPLSLPEGDGLFPVELDDDPHQRRTTPTGSWR